MTMMIKNINVIASEKNPFIFKLGMSAKHVKLPDTVSQAEVRCFVL